MALNIKDPKTERFAAEVATRPQRVLAPRSSS